jgi:hypothetical protein
MPLLVFFINKVFVAKNTIGREETLASGIDALVGIFVMPLLVFFTNKVFVAKSTISGEDWIYFSVNLSEQSFIFAV